MRVGDRDSEGASRVTPSASAAASSAALDDLTGLTLPITLDCRLTSGRVYVTTACTSRNGSGVRRVVGWMVPPTADAGRLDAGRELRLGVVAPERVPVVGAAAPLLYRVEWPVCGEAYGEKAGDDWRVDDGS